jgi:putative peptidoglycan lipid II flippase
MVLAQLPSFLRHVGLPKSWRAYAPAVTLGAFAPIAVYTLSRQAQVFVERYLGSSLEPGTISHLNYATKVAQMPMMVALLICTVTFPALARNVAAGEADQARRRLEADLRTVTALIFVSAAFLIAFAPQIVSVLLEHGRFTPQDTEATAAIMRVYALGLFGHALVGVLSRPFFLGERRTWYPALAMGAGLLATAVLAVGGVQFLGVYAIAGANGVGITITAVLLLIGLRGRFVAVSLVAVGSATARLAVAAALAGVLGVLTGQLLGGMPAVVVAVIGGTVVLAAFAGLARLAGFDEVTAMASALRRRIRDGR